MCNEGDNDGANLYAEANNLFYKALVKYRAARIAIIDELDKAKFDRITRMIETFADAGVKLVNNGEKRFNLDTWNSTHSH